MTVIKKKRKILRFIPVLILILILGIFAAGSVYLVEFAIGRKQGINNVAPTSVVTETNQSTMKENWSNMHAKTNEWTSKTEQEEISIVSEDGLKLKGSIFWTNKKSHKWLLGIHGYTSNQKGMWDIGAYYGEKDYNVLTPDMRAHGESEGSYIGMGWLDRKDVLLWIEEIIKLDPKAEIVLHGVSMGGATVMMVSGEELPKQVKCIVEDCGYTSVWDIFSDEMKYLFHLPEFPLLYTASVYSSWKAGYDFKEASSVKQVEKCQVPMLFIHGEKDNFVHTEMVYEVYAACHTEKELLVMEGAGHGNSYWMNPELYFDTVFRFIDKIK